MAQSNGSFSELEEGKWMTDKDRTELSFFEAKILEFCNSVDAGNTLFVEAGNALRVIRDETLYRSIHDTFDEYCNGRWRFTCSRASELIQTASVVGELARFGVHTLPASESQAMMIGRMADNSDERGDLWRRVVDKAPQYSGRPDITDQLIRDVYESGKGEAVVDDDFTNGSDEGTKAKMKQWNSSVESWAQGLAAFIEKTPSGVWLDEVRIGFIKSDLKSAANSARAAKGYVVCRLCNGEGCDECRKSGFLTKFKSDGMKSWLPF
jgi:hypothetical protein